MNASNSISKKSSWHAIYFCLISILAAFLLLAGLCGFFKLNAVQAAIPAQPAAPAVTDFAVGVYTDVISLDPALAGWDPLHWWWSTRSMTH